MPSATVPATAKQACDTLNPRQWRWVKPTVWSEPMLAALVNGVTGGKWYRKGGWVIPWRIIAAGPMPFSLSGGLSP